MFALSRMIQSEAQTTDPDCIDRIHREREALKKGVLLDVHEQEDWLLTNSAISRFRESPASGIAPIQAEAADLCEEPLRSCGNCHLPQRNNCNYTIVYTLKGEIHRASGRVSGIDDLFLTIIPANEQPGVFRLEGEESSSATPGADQSVRIPVDTIVRTHWINGDDPLISWWDFDRFNHRGEVAHEMLSIAAQNNVACTNCHLRHGDFALTPAGEEFHRSGRVVRNEPLSTMFDIASPNNSP